MMSKWAHNTYKSVRDSGKSQLAAANDSTIWTHESGHSHVSMRVCTLSLPQFFLNVRGLVCLKVDFCGSAIIVDKCWNVQLQVVSGLHAADTTDGQQFSKVEHLCLGNDTAATASFFYMQRPTREARDRSLEPRTGEWVWQAYEARRELAQKHAVNRRGDWLTTKNIKRHFPNLF